MLPIEATDPLRPEGKKSRKLAINRRLRIEPSDPSLREKNRRDIQHNLTQPGFHLPSPTVFGVNHRHWWTALAANRYTHCYANRTSVAQQLVELYEACIAEVENLRGPTNGVVDRAEVWTPELFTKIRRRLVSENSAWGNVSEREGKRDLSYGIGIFDRARKGFLEHPTRLRKFGRYEEQLYRRLWRLVDNWLDLMTEGNKVFVPGGASVASRLDFAGILTPACTIIHLDNHGSGSEKQNRQSLKPGDKDEGFMGPLTMKPTSNFSNLENRLAEENLQTTEKPSELEHEKASMRAEVDAVRSLNGETLEASLTKMHLPQHTRP